ncbi:Protein transport protein Sec24B [Armadillidium nasatum]|uniref:Protein transport protein Sec24B n=1 Tax=Armadillidium nasatum TaxID=96803 RepID=A0A5N5SKK6_9CRUS|nr:Protein transport protein Sec24B [Armadillidium nasatum]
MPPRGISAPSMGISPSLPKASPLVGPPPLSVGTTTPAVSPVSQINSSSVRPPPTSVGFQLHSRPTSYVRPPQSPLGTSVSSTSYSSGISPSIQSAHPQMSFQNSPGGPPTGVMLPNSSTFNPPVSVGPPPTSKHSSSSSLSGNYSPYVTQQQPLSQTNVHQVSRQFGGMSVTKDGWNKGWGTATCDLLQQKCVVPPHGVEPLSPVLAQEYLPNCSPDLFRCTLTKIPETQSVLQKSRMPFGILIHPFKDLEHLAVVSCNTIVRCRSCRTYINPFVVFKGDRRWECNLCFRVNEIPDEFLFDPLSRTYGDPSRRPEVREATIEFIAPQEYMLRPPQPAAYVYVLDVSRQAVETGYLKIVCETLLAYLDKIPGDRRTLIGFITYSATIQFYLMGEGLKNVQLIEVGEINDMFVPSPEDLLVNLDESRSLVEDLLDSLPETHANTVHTQTALGAALTAAYKLISPIGGRITVMSVTLPTLGPGALKPREDPNQRSAKDISHLGPATDFYKKFALDCSGQQIAVDLFTLNSQYIDLATLSGMSKFSGGCIYHFPGFHSERNSPSVLPFRSCFIRYLTRKIGFEAVMRIRATRGLAITNFHGNFFVRSTDLLSLPNVNPDSGFGMQVNLEEPLHNIRQACFQAALLYTSRERRIRVHTLCLPVTPNIHEVLNGGDQQAIVGLLAKMAVDKCLSAQMSDAREALVNACCDALSAYKASLSSYSGLPAPPTLQMMPLYILGLLKSVALRHGLSTKLDDRVFAMCELKSLPLCHLIQTIYPDLYPIHNLSEKGAINIEDMVVPQPGRLHLSAEYIDRNGAYLLDAGCVIYVYIRGGISPQWVNDVIGVPSFAAIPQPLYEESLPFVDNATSELARNFVVYLQKNKPFPVPVQIIREDNPSRVLFINYLVDDRSEGARSYVEFLQFVKSQVK